MQTGRRPAPFGDGRLMDFGNEAHAGEDIRVAHVIDGGLARGLDVRPLALPSGKTMPVSTNPAE
jgi:hypothetical protein